jgi:DNA-binding CsgD family transcriptional regulator
MTTQPLPGDLEREAAALLPGLYGAAGDDAAWRPLFESMKERLQLAAAGITFRSADGFSQTWAGLPPEYEEPYVRHYHQHDPWVAGAARRGKMKTGTVAVGSDLVADDELRRNECYQDLCLPLGLTDLVALVADGEDGRLVSAAVMLLPNSRWNARELGAAMHFLAPHFSSVIRLRRRLAHVPLWEQALTNALDRVPVAALALGAGRRVIRLNAQAQQLTRQPPVKLLAHGTLDVGSPAHNAALEEALRLHRPWSLTLHAEGGARVLLFLAPLTPGVDPADAGPRGMLHVFHSRLQTEAPAALLQRVYALTPAETKLCALVAQGISPLHAAGRLGVAHSTAQKQLKSVMHKLGVRRQPELVRLVAGLASLPRD